MKRALFTFATLLITPLALLAASSAQEGATKPNIILVMPDDTGYGDYACLGNPIMRTPVLDAFKKESLLFTQFHVSPTCSPCRSALMSGRHEFKNGVTHTIGGRERMAPATFTLPQMLKTVGYTSGIFGKWHLGDEEAYRPESRGFDEVYIHGSGGIGQSGDAPGNTNNDPALWHNGKFETTKGYCTDLFFAQAIKWMNKKREAKEPFFAYIPLNAAHAPHVVPKDYYQQYVGAPKVSEEVAKYFGMLENIDTNFGTLLAKLKEWDIEDNTLVIYLGTDNGGTAGVKIFNAGMKGLKATPYQGGTRAPAFFRWPAGGIPAGAECDALSAHLDLFPTLAEITGATLSPEVKLQVEGSSLVPLLKNPKAEWTDRKLVHHVGRWPAGKAEDFKYAKCAIQDARFTLVNNEELYDLKADPGENTNVIAQHADVAARLRAAYDQWWEDVQPLLVNEKVTGFNNFTFRELYVKQFGADSIEAVKPGTPDSDTEGDSRANQLKRREERKKRQEATPKVPVEGQEIAPNRSVTYKSVGGIDLQMDLFEPEGLKPTDHRPAIVFFFGGGWSGGSTKQFYQQARALADQGMVAFSADYRVKGRNKTTPFECVTDGKSAIRWVRQHAAEFRIDPERIVAAGGSAGGHVAACTGVIEGNEEAGENAGISSVPNAMILFNPVLDTTEKGYGAKNFKPEQQTHISPCHHVRKGIVPTLVFHGTADKTVPFENAERFTRLMKEAGNECVLVPFEGKDHGFFNGSFFRKSNGDADHEATMQRSIEFLKANGFLK